MKRPKFDPVDLRQCQAEISNHTPFSLGPPEWRRCSSTPLYVATERKIGLDGHSECGAQSIVIKTDPQAGAPKSK